jgi:methylmalonyl-CoA/ethylmalonyl-CoA epimerase
MILDHIGLVVQSIEETARHWEELFGYRRKSSTVLNTRQKVRVLFLGKPGSLTLKLVEPAGTDSPVSALAKKGGGLHHLCFRCENVQISATELQKKGAVLMVRPQPGEAFNGHDIAFLMARGNVNIELIDTLEKQGWLGPEEESALRAGTGSAAI